jgi:hypothetical protein
MFLILVKMVKRWKEIGNEEENEENNNFGVLYLKYLQFQTNRIIRIQAICKFAI